MDVQQPAVSASYLPSLRELLASAFRERRKLLWAGGGVLCLTLVIAFLVPTKYEATASLLVLPGEEYAPQPEAGGTPTGASSNSLAREEFLPAEVEILGSA